MKKFQILQFRKTKTNKDNQKKIYNLKNIYIKIKFYINNQEF